MGNGMDWLEPFIKPPKAIVLDANEGTFSARYEHPELTLDVVPGLTLFEDFDVNWAGIADEKLDLATTVVEHAWAKNGRLALQSVLEGEATIELNGVVSGTGRLKTGVSAQVLDWVALELNIGAWGGYDGTEFRGGASLGGQLVFTIKKADLDFIIAADFAGDTP